MRSARVRVAAIAIAVAAAVIVAPPTARAQSGATLVAIVTAEPNASLTRRVREELRSLGVDVIVLKPPAESSPLRAPLEQAARGVGAIAAVRLVASSEGKVEVWVADRVTGKAVVRELDAPTGETSDAAVALATVELFRASLMEIHAVEPPHGDVPVTEKVRALALPTADAAGAQRPSAPRLGLAAGGAIDLGLRGLGPSAGVDAALSLRLPSRFGLRALAYASIAPAHTSAPAGSVDARPLWFGVLATYDFADESSAWAPSVAAGLGAAHLSTTGTAVPPFVGTTDSAWFALPMAGAGLAWSMARGLRLRGDAIVAWAVPGAAIGTPGATAARWAAPAVVTSVDLEMLWGP